MALESTLESHHGKDTDTQIKELDHTVSDIEAVPTNSRALVVIPNSNNNRSQSNWTRIITAISFAALIGPAIYLRTFFHAAELLIDPTDYAARTKRALSQTPLIDGHNDLPYLLRVELRNKIYEGFDFKQKLLGHTDIERMRKGQVGGQFWSCYVECPGVVNPKLYKQENLDQPTVSFRPSLELL